MKLRWAVILLFVNAGLVMAQHNSEPLKLGSTTPRDSWRGTVKSLDNSNGSITLEYEHKGKVESFTGILKAPIAVYAKNGNPAPPPIHIQMGDRLLVRYYKEGSKYSSNEGGKRHDEVAKANLIVEVNFLPE